MARYVVVFTLVYLGFMLYSSTRADLGQLVNRLLSPMALPLIICLFALVASRRK